MNVKPGPKDEKGMCEGNLRLNDDGRWELDGIELISGDVIWLEVACIWMAVEIEREGKKYHAKPRIIQLETGMKAQR